MRGAPRTRAGAARAVFDDLLPMVNAVTIDEVLHFNAVATLLGADRQDRSRVDFVSFEV